MDWQRTAYISGIFIVGLLLLIEWNKFTTQQKLERSQQISSEITTGSNTTTISDTINNTATATTSDSHSELPYAPVVSSAEVNGLPTASDTSKNEPKTNNDLIRITTDAFDILIDKRGGDIVKVSLPKHKARLGEDKAYTLLNRTANTTYLAQSGIVGVNATDTASGRPLFSSSNNIYTLGDNEDTLTVDLTLQQAGVFITKRFTFTRNDYLINISYLVDNQTASPWQGSLYGQIKRDRHIPVAAADSGFGVTPYLGAATTTIEDHYQKLDFDDLSDKTTKFSLQGGWVAMIQHYFLSAWIPNSKTTNTFRLLKLNNKDLYILEFSSPPVTIAAGEKGQLSADFYVGPKNIKRLETISPYLDLTIDFGWLWWIAKYLFKVLLVIDDAIGNWGWSIIVLTFIIKAIFFYPSAISYRSMAKMRKLSPKMQRLKEMYGDDRQKMSQEMMSLYKKEKVNPMGGCLPILIQMPVFISLYWVLMESVELRHAPFMLWIADLSVKDPYFILPLIMGLTMYIQQTLNPTPPDPLQAKIMQWMPVAFTFMFLWFPAGLVVYWVTNNILSIIQQYLITRKIEAEG
ncbi:membrane protein insertase YidC [Candidatus Endobugula sertula]|uniref:Membrane protein insertase YidC n=1 Tax=Candidatus Endobugula sertula TaxID=62101 RepID=A0A1D2QSB4_9GAMM|nr:membrane protein insertase YidC [Candidatus Endobugula sertula]